MHCGLVQQPTSLVDFQPRRVETRGSSRDRYAPRAASAQPTPGQRSVIQSFGDLINQSFSDSINQSINQSISESVNQSINESFCHSVNHSLIHSFLCSIKQAIKEAIHNPLTHARSLGYASKLDPSFIIINHHQFHVADEGRHVLPWSTLFLETRRRLK